MAMVPPGRNSHKAEAAPKTRLLHGFHRLHWRRQSGQAIVDLKPSWPSSPSLATQKSSRQTVLHCGYPLASSNYAAHGAARPSTQYRHLDAIAGPATAATWGKSPTKPSTFGNANSARIRSWRARFHMRSCTGSFSLPVRTKLHCSSNSNNNNHNTE